jgi:hypothetical protein
MSAKGTIRPVAKVLARVGLVSIGTVYVLIGVWALLALLRVARPAADEERILQRLVEMPLGRPAIAAIAAGALSYILWLLFEAVFDPYDFGRTAKGVTERIGIGLSTLAYGVIVSAALKVLGGSGGQGEAQQQRLVDRVLELPVGRWLVGAVGLLVALAGLYQLKYVYDGDHRRHLELDGRGRFARRLFDVLAWAGYGARCVILAVLGGFLLKAAWSFDPNAVGDTDSAFDFLGLGGGPVGNALFSVVAVGTISYGLFMYANAVYFRFERKDAREPSG